MSLALCGLSIPYESQHAEPIAANRLHRTAQHDFSNWANADDIAGTVKGAIDDGLGIIRAIQSKAPCDINNVILDRSRIKEELIILAGDTKKIRATVAKKFGITEHTDKIISMWGETVSFKSLCTEIGGLADQMIKQVPLYKSMKKEALLLLGLQDKTSQLSLLPKDIINVILQKRIEVASAEINKKVEQIAIQ